MKKVWNLIVIKIQKHQIPEILQICQVIYSVLLKIDELERFFLAKIGHFLQLSIFKIKSFEKLPVLVHFSDSSFWWARARRHSRRTGWRSCGAIIGVANSEKKISELSWAFEKLCWAELRALPKKLSWSSWVEPSWAAAELGRAELSWAELDLSWGLSKKLSWSWAELSWAKNSSKKATMS